MERKNNMDLFMEGEWSGKVTSQALQNLSFKKHNKPCLLPITNDLMTLRTFLHDNILALTNEVHENPVKENWRKLAVLALARLIIFNKRRGIPIIFFVCFVVEQLTTEWPVHLLKSHAREQKTLLIKLLFPKFWEKKTSGILSSK